MCFLPAPACVLRFFVCLFGPIISLMNAAVEESSEEEEEEEKEKRRTSSRSGVVFVAFRVSAILSGPCFCSHCCSSCSRGGEEIGRPHLFGACSCCACSCCAC